MVVRQSDTSTSLCGILSYNSTAVRVRQHFSRRFFPAVPRKKQTAPAAVKAVPAISIVCTGRFLLFFVLSQKLSFLFSLSGSSDFTPLPFFSIFHRRKHPRTVPNTGYSIDDTEGIFKLCFFMRYDGAHTCPTHPL